MKSREKNHFLRLNQILISVFKMNCQNIKFFTKVTLVIKRRQLGNGPKAK